MLLALQRLVGLQECKLHQQQTIEDENLNEVVP
jgi:hypothetical protein